MQDIATGTLDSYLRDMVTAMVDERMGSAATRGDAMARLYGEYVKPGKAAEIMGVSASTVIKLREEGWLDMVPHVGISVRSIAEMPERARMKEPTAEVRRSVSKITARIDPHGRHIK